MSWQDEEPCDNCGAPRTSKPPQQTFDVRPMLRYRVRCEQGQATRLLAKLTEIVRDDARERRIKRVTLGGSGPVGQAAQQWHVVFECDPELRIEVSGYLQSLGLKQEE